MDKLTIATQVLLKLIETNKTGFDAEGISGYAWEIADAMQAEAEKREDKTRPEVLEEWQLDWSQAPEWANWWATDSIGYSAWYSYEPYHGDGRDYWSDYKNKYDNSEKSGKAPSFNYQGNWQDSLRKRPEPKCKVDWRVAPQDATGWKMKEGRAYWIDSDGWIIEGAPSFGFTGTHIMERPHGI